MRNIRRIAVCAAALVLLAVAWMWAMPPMLFRVGSAYAAKIVCSNVFLAGRDAEAVLADDVQAPGHPLLRIMRVSVDREAGQVSAGLFGFIGDGLAIHRPGLGCTVIPDGDVAAATLPDVALPAAVPNPDLPWPAGETIVPSQNSALAAILDDAALTGPGMRAVVVVKDGRIVGERYGEGFSASTPLLGWSMTKTVTAALVGTLVADGRMAVDTTNLLPAWSGDGRRDISIANLLAMSPGLQFNEDYGDVTDVTSMLYAEADMAAFAAAKPLEAPPGTKFNYSSGTSLIVSRLAQQAAGGGALGLAWPRERLFGPLGMRSAIQEPDARGTLAGSSYLYATAHDWARFGQFLLDDGIWNGRRMLPEGFVAWMREPAPASGGLYGRGQLWLKGPDTGLPEGTDPNTGVTLPDDAFWALGHDGQSLAVIPSERLVVLRMGLTPSKLGYKSQAMVQALVKALQ